MYHAPTDEEPQTFAEAGRRLNQSVRELIEAITDIMLQHERTLWLVNFSLGGILLIWFAIDLWPSEWSISIVLFGCLSLYFFVTVWTDG